MLRLLLEPINTYIFARIIQKNGQSMECTAPQHCTMPPLVLIPQQNALPQLTWVNCTPATAVVVAEVSVPQHSTVLPVFNRPHAALQPTVICEYTLVDGYLSIIQYHMSN
jgi:hypothetical protein